mmetsp:Transcript_13131/g.20398  ORF Transcript_13131/g.20398 Transcript_13131/m.20398 type:complete len:211 (-) Transcript_13131:850-1482(-)
MKDKNQRHELVKLKDSNEDWERRTKKLFLEVQQKEIYTEKRDYERKLRMSEMVAVMKDQKKKIEVLEEQMAIVRQMEEAEEAQKEMEVAQGRSLAQSILSAGEEPSFGSSNKKQGKQFTFESGATGNTQIKEEDEDDANSQGEFKEVQVEEEDDDEEAKNEFGDLEGEFHGFNADDEMLRNPDHDDEPDVIPYASPDSKPGSFVDPSLRT